MRPATAAPDPRQTRAIRGAAPAHQGRAGRRTVNQATVIGFGDGVYGEVATFQVLLQGDRCCSIKAESVIARPGFAFTASQCVLLVALGMQEHRKVLAHRFESTRQHGRRCAADDHEIAINDWSLQQLVTHRATDQIGVHQSFAGCTVDAATADEREACAFATSASGHITALRLLCASGAT